MKNKAFSLKLSLVLLILIVISCKKESDSTMIGKWDVTTHIYTIYQNNVKISEESYTYNAGEFVLVINADGTGKYLENGNDGVTFTWEKVSDNKFTIVQKPDQFTTISGDLEIFVDKNTLTWTSIFVLNTYKFQNYLVCNKI